MIDTILYTRIKKSVMFHDVLHGFRVGMGMGTAIMELKLAQDLESVDQDLLLLVFLEIRKAYDNLEPGRLLKTLEEYRAGSKMRGILTEFWV